MASAGASLDTYGQCRQELWPYSVEITPCGPSKDALNDGLSRRAILKEVSHDAMTVMSLLQQLIPIVLVLPVCEEFFEPDKGFVHTPTPLSVYEELHAVLGTDIVRSPHFGEVIEFRNSWGAGWGDQGYGCVLPEFIDKHCVYAATLTVI